MMPSLSELSRTAMVYGAGRGSRLYPLTDTVPKPLQEVGPKQAIGRKKMIDYALDKLAEIGIERVVVNTHWLAEQMDRHLRGRTDVRIVISHEDKLLETGGGTVKALSYFEDKPFFALNADLPLIDGPVPSLLRMKQEWDAAKMDALLLMMPTEKARGFDGARGDYAMEADGRLWRENLQPPRPYVYVGAQILNPKLFANPPGEKFSNNHVWNLAEADKRLYGIIHEGTCYHISTVADLKHANDLMDTGKGWGV